MSNSSDAARVREQVAKRYPEMADVEPTVSPVGTGGKGTTAKGAAPKEVLAYTFEKRVSTPDGATMKRVVRASVDAQGHIVKLALSK
jgi:hypothetical protein